ncbi:MAG: hypothetical protein IH848_06175, partial [Acidobacteria bacterium]|nr:hypothetical protein [Acidobacteriota bacterium]
MSTAGRTVCGSLLALALLTTPNHARSPFGLVADGTSDSVVVFDTTPDSIVTSISVSPSFSSLANCAVSFDGSLAYSTDNHNNLWVHDLLTNPNPTLASGTNPITVSNGSDDVAITPDSQYAVVCGRTSQDIAVIDLPTRIEVSTFNVGCHSVAICADSTVLVVDGFDDTLQRLTIDASGNLQSTGDEAALRSDVRHIYCSADSRSAVVTMGPGGNPGSDISSFRLPGLEIASNIRVPVDSAAIRGDGSALYVLLDDTLTAYSYNSTTAVIGAPAYSVAVPLDSNPLRLRHLTLDPSETKLYASRGASVLIHDPANGALIDTLVHTDLVSAGGVCTWPILDTDSDGLTSYYEAQAGTDPDDPDSDSDGLLDGFEVTYGFDPLTPGDGGLDGDGDGLDNLAEQQAGTDPTDPDSDGDGLTDGQEVALGIDPLSTDTDEDGLPDDREVNVEGTDPSDPDTDGGGRSDGAEVDLDLTDPLDPGDDVEVVVGLAVDRASESVLVFDTETDEIIGSFSLPPLVPMNSLAPRCALTASNAQGLSGTDEPQLLSHDLTLTPPAGSSGTVPINLANTPLPPGIHLTSDDGYAVFCTGVAVSVVDLATGVELSSYPYFSDFSCQLDVCQDSTVLVALDNGEGIRRLVRLTVDAAGMIQFQDETFVNSGFKVFCSTDAKSAILSFFSHIESVLLPGLESVDTRQGPWQGGPVTMRGDGSAVFVRGAGMLSA